MLPPVKKEARSTDTVTITVIQNGLVAAADEMFAVLRKTAMSPIIYEILDVGTGITDAKGGLVSSGAGIPTFVGVLDKAVQRILECEGQTNIHDGDMFITNDPYYGGVTHLNDVVIAQPVFAADELVAWTASIAHWSDVGGLTPGSMATNAQEIFQEGLRLPAVRLFQADQPVASVFDIIMANSRLPDYAQGDLWAQVAASRRATERIKGLVATYGLAMFHAAVTDAYAEGRQRSLTGLADLPVGLHNIEAQQDDGALWRATITIKEDRFIIDLRDNPKQLAAPYNTSRDGAVIASQMIFKALCDPTLFANAGTFTPLEVRTEPGTIFHATGSAPHGYYFETRIRLYDLLWHCLAEEFPERLPAGHFGSICGTVIVGEHPDHGRKYSLVEPQMGGWGATATQDGLSAMYSASHGETFNCPTEICESRYGLDVKWRKLGGAGLGAGRQRGGRGLVTSYRLRSPAVLSAGFSRNRLPVWGLQGGAPGGTNSLVIQRLAGPVEEYAFISGLELNKGDEIHITTAAGGGWGALADTTPAIADSMKKKL